MFCIPMLRLPAALANYTTRAVPDASHRLGRRHLQVAMLSLGLALAYSCRINLSVCIVEMTTKNSTRGFPVSTSTCTSWSVRWAAYRSCAGAPAGECSCVRPTRAPAEKRLGNAPHSGVLRAPSFIR